MNDTDRNDDMAKSSSSLASMTCCPPYMTLIPQGLHYVTREWVQARINLTQSIWVGDYSPQEQQSLISGNKSLYRNEAVVKAPVGTVSGAQQDLVKQKSQDRSVGYNLQQDVIWTQTGQHTYLWWQFGTPAPAAHVASLRAIGPITALVDSWSLPTSSASLDEIASAIRIGCLQTDSYRNVKLPSALRIWNNVARTNWTKDLTSQRIRDFSVDEEDLFSSHRALKFRISCVRPDDGSTRHNHAYTRRDLIMAIANDLVPSSWSVDLENYDVEIVLFLRENHFAIGLALHPYQLVGSTSFSAGAIPPDVAPPYIAPTGIVRLRPATAQLLLYLADLPPGAIVLDPCVGMGTIAHECAFQQCVGLGGDIVLTPSLLAPQAAQYSAAIRNEHQIAATLVAWDAANIPIRTGVVDAVVSDLPFGRQCLSSSKLKVLLPLIMNEMARVLQPSVGKMVLLCGHYKVVIEALEHINQMHGSKGTSLMWQFPCAALFPVNIGGMLAWVLQIQRGSGIWQPSTFSSETVRRLTAKNEMANMHPSAKKKKLQR